MQVVMCGGKWSCYVWGEVKLLCVGESEVVMCGGEVKLLCVGGK